MTVGGRNDGLTLAANGVEDLTAGFQHQAECDNDEEPTHDAHGHALSSAWSGPDDLADVPPEPVSSIRAVSTIRDQAENDDDDAEQDDGTKCSPAEGVLPVVPATRLFV
jgi:hypothetical protein